MLQFEIAKELGRLASILDTKAATADALAAEHAKLQQVPDWQKQITLSKNAKHFAAVCRAGQDKLKAKGGKSERCEPPTWEAVVEYAKTKHPGWPLPDVQSWFNHFESVGWVIGKSRTPMKNWQRAADNGFKNYAERRGPTGTTRLGSPVPAIAPGDPEGWAEWLKTAAKRPYKAWKYEHEFLKKKFLERVK